MLSFLEFLYEWVTPGAQLFHKDIGIPPELARPKAGMKLMYGPHTPQRAREKNITSLPSTIPDQFDVVEIEAIRGRASKWLLRVPMKNDPRDLVMAVGADGFVRTCWPNAKNDTHKTLNRSAYTLPTKFIKAR